MRTTGRANQGGPAVADPLLPKPWHIAATMPEARHVPALTTFDPLLLTSIDPGGRGRVTG
jgi:hypothetical protein